MMFAPRAFLFDLDGVLWDSNPIHEWAIAETCKEAGLVMPPYSLLAGLSTPDAFERVLAENGNPPGHDVSRLSVRKRALFQEHIAEVPSDEDALQTALAERRPEFLALVTGASRATAAAYLRRLPGGFFDLVMTAEDGLPSKPAPDVYLAAADRLGVHPAECVVFEDSEAGLTAAQLAGTRVARITFAWGGRCDEPPCACDWCAETVPEALASIWGAS